MILAIDPGSEKSAYAILDKNLKPYVIGIIENDRLLRMIPKYNVGKFAIEMIASYGMAVGKEVFETCVWIGRFIEEAYQNKDIYYIQQIYRKDVKMNLCQSMRAKDGNIRQALIDRFGVVGTKKNPGWFYGVSKDVWSAIAVGVTYYDLYLKSEVVS